MQKACNLDAYLKSRQYKPDLMADFMRMKFETPKLKQSQIANQLGYSTSTLQRYRNELNMLSTYRIQPNSTNKQTEKFALLILTTIHMVTLTLKDLVLPQMTSNQLQKNYLLKLYLLKVKTN